MSENEVQENPSGGAAAGTAVKALAAAAVTGAAAYAVQKALSSRNGHADTDDETASPESLEDEPETDEDDSENRDDSPESKEQQEADDEGDGEEDDEDEPRSEGDEEVEDDAEYEEAEDDDPAENDQPGSAIARRSSGGTNKLRLVGASALAGATPALVPFAGEAANSAGRYVAEHAPDIVTQTIVPRFIDGFKKAS